MSYSSPITREARFGTLLPDIMGLQGYQTHIANDNCEKDSIELEYLRTREIMSRYSRKRSSFLPPELSLSPNEPGKRSAYIYETGFPHLPRADQSVKTEKKVKKFCTGSKYFGGYNQLGMSGRGSITNISHKKNRKKKLLYYRYLQISTWSDLRRVLQ